ncbi:unnamed protein product [Arabidopsis lyrata]|nr:unnamed protein product [Arabidopsis lyrata]
MCLLGETNVCRCSVVGPAKLSNEILESHHLGAN